MQSLDVKLNLLQTRIYFLLGKLIGFSKLLAPNEASQLVATVELLDKEIQKFVKSFKEK